MALTGLSPKSPAQNAARIFVKAGSHSVTKCAFLDLEPFVPYNDKYGPSCLVQGFTPKGRPLLIQCSYPSRPILKIVTVYEPDGELWIGFKARRSKQEG